MNELTKQGNKETNFYSQLSSCNFQVNIGKIKPQNISQRSDESSSTNSRQVSRDRDGTKDDGQFLQNFLLPLNKRLLKTGRAIRRVAVI